MRKLLLLCIVPIVLLGQDFIEAKGQNVSFTLAPGAKAGWNSLSSVEKTFSLPATGAQFMSSTSNGLFIKGSIKGVVKVFDIRGRLNTTINIDRQGFVIMPTTVSNGLYFARLDVLGKTVATTKLAVVR